MREILISIILLMILGGIALGRYPYFRMNRATITLIGALLLLVAGAITLPQAYAAIDMNTILLLFSMMIVNANLHICGFFALVAKKVLALAKTPRQLLFLVIFSSGILSSFFLNDTVVLIFTPLVLEILHHVDQKPVPYLIALATAANIGSVATIIGNPQNMLIGIYSHIPFSTFSLMLSPLAIINLFIIYFLVIIVFRKNFRTVLLPSVIVPRPHVYRPLLIKSLAVTAGILGALLVGVPIPLAAFAGASVLLFTRRLKPERVFSEINWTLLVFFSGLFVVTRSIETSGLLIHVQKYMGTFAGKQVAEISIISALLSNIVSNVPAVLLIEPLMRGYANQIQGWLTLAMATTFAGNLTLIGSVANLIVAESARLRGVHLTFFEYLKIGIPITIISIFLGILWLILLY
ncbi:MAG: anion transporter [Candidatus Fischerbacteria bacterium RBG_13_37_8]|uniref:Anion transporter n=1 Tax=Candidatus Fischerbacteria bacterium RBG_13_37_8 TaxID=1817863 RepID=A0A1F5VK99_9BACT|nr:MAG: anion transporter [Candidatus Fischerbacteria bacterium RBG_13_37_8]